MRFEVVKLLLITIAAVSTVKSECDTYFECIGSFFDNFFSNYKNLKKETEVSNITVPGFNTIKIDSDNLRNLLSSVSGFIQEELEGSVSFGPQLNVFKNKGNSAAIYVKSITINNNFENYDYQNTSKNNSNKTIDQEIYYHSNSSNSSNITKTVSSTSNNIKESEKEEKDKLNKKIVNNEIFDDNYPFGIYYDTDEDDNSTDYLKIDYLEIYKDTTNEYIDVKPTELPKDVPIDKVNDYDKEITSMRPDAIMFENYINNSSVSENIKCNNDSKNVPEAIFPWIAAIFVKNDSSDQFDYYCDGALLSETVVITAARCMNYYGSKVDANNLLVLLGKNSLQSMSAAERAVKVKSVIVHDNFTTEASPANDIALLLMEGVVLSEHIQTACLGGETGLEAVTTGWAILGELTIIPFEADRNLNCNVSNENNTFCAAYGNEVTVCPSYGSVYAVKQGLGWYLRGIRSGDPTDRGLCFDRRVYFTDLGYYNEWIDINSKGVYFTDLGYYNEWIDINSE